MKVQVRDSKSDKLLVELNEVSETLTIFAVKKAYNDLNKKLYPARQGLKSSPDGKILKDEEQISDLTNPRDPSCVRLYFRDLGPQIGWDTVFYVEYAGPLVIYLSMWLLSRPELKNPLLNPMKTHLNLRSLALLCWCGHFAKRLAETKWIHRFSHGTMPVRSLYKNCSFYWGFAAFIGYFTNHRLYTEPAFGCVQICLGLAIFLVGEVGNFSCHLALRRLRPEGSTVRRVPKPIPGWPLTQLFNLVACPNYTYEVFSWIGFTIMTQTLPAAIFTFVGFFQMRIWAINKLRAYRKEFADFPKNRKAIIPFVV